MDEVQKEYYRNIAKLSKYKRRLAEATETIKKAVGVCDNPCVSFSFGKDSLVCLDIAVKVKPDILIVNIDRGKGGDIEEAVDLYEQYAEKNGLNYHRVKTPKSIFDMLKEAGSINNIPPKAFTRNLKKGFEIANKKFNTDCEIMGLRAEENRERRHLLKYGTFHYSKTENRYKCKPVLHWKGEEIWAYIISNNLPYVSYYDREAKFVGYENARYGNLIGNIGNTIGRITRLKYNNPNEYEEIRKEFPEISKYT